MSKLHGCLQCLCIGVPRTLQIRRASYVSLGNLWDQEELETIPPVTNISHERSIRELSNLRGIAVRNEPRTRREVRPQSGVRDSIPQLDDTYEPTWSSPKRLRSGPLQVYEDEVERPQEIILAHIERLGILAPWLETPPQEVWSHCKALLSSRAQTSPPADREISRGIVNCLGLEWPPLGKAQTEIFDTTLLRLMGEITSNCTSRSILPPPAKILDVFKEADLLRRSVLAKILRLQLTRILQSVRNREDQLQAGRDARIPLASMLSDVLSVWDECRQKPSKQQSLRYINDYSTRSFNDVCTRLRHWEPRIHSTCIVPMAVTAVVAQSVRASGPILENLKAQGSLWNKIEDLTSNCFIEEKHIVEFLDDTDVSEFALDTIRGSLSARKLQLAVREANTVATSSTIDQSALAIDVSPASQATDPISMDDIVLEMKPARSEANVDRLIALWQQCKKRVEQGGMHDEVGQGILCQLTHTFFKLERSDMAVEIYNTMRKSGITPMTGYWRVLLIGCLHEKDAVSMAGFWSKMELLGITPDEAMWTARIQTLILGGMLNEGVKALEDLSRTWKRNVSSGLRKLDRNAPGSDTAASPTPVSPLNPLKAALSSLRSSGRVRLVTKIFAWAKTESLPIDTDIFNILLLSRVKKAVNDTDVHAILADMGLHSCKPDVSTYTIILDGILSNASSDFHHKGSNEQAAFLLGMLDTMQRQNIAPDERTYDTILRGLLGRPSIVTDSKNVPVARAVLDRMTSASASMQISPSPHVFTTFMTYYFSLQPPDLDAVSSLWSSIEASLVKRSCLDALFYDKMIENYAKLGSTERMLYFLRTMVKARRTPGYLALLGILRRLVECQDWDAAAELVSGVEGGPGKGLLRYQQRSTKGKHEFWELVKSCRDEGYLS